LTSVKISAENGHILHRELIHFQPARSFKRYRSDLLETGQFETASMASQACTSTHITETKGHLLHNLDSTEDRSRPKFGSHFHALGGCSGHNPEAWYSLANVCSLISRRWKVLIGILRTHQTGLSHFISQRPN